MSQPRPLDARSFARLIAAAGPFGPRPRIAVGVSGGRDSLALVLLLDRWARTRGGAVHALTVDHGMRAGSAAEARDVGRWMKARSIAHSTLRRTGPAPKTALAATAREARFRLLSDWCRRNGVLFLALAHHLEDQAETVLLRVAGGSGAEGLAAMAPRVAAADMAVIRPLLGVPRARLAATLEAMDQPWIEDPSNRDPRHARVRVRALLPALAAENLDARAWGQAAAKLAEGRAVVAAAVARLIAATVTLDPSGFAVIDPAFLAADPLLQARALGRVLACVGGTAFPPAADALARLIQRLAEGAGGATLGRCRVAPASRSGPVVVCREARNLPAGQSLKALPTGRALYWDGRFALGPLGRSAIAGSPIGATGGKARARPRVPVLAPLGWEGWRALIRARPAVAQGPVPAVQAATLPAFWDGANLLSVPHLVYNHDGNGGRPAAGRGFACVFQPMRPLSGPGTILV